MLAFADKRLSSSSVQVPLNAVLLLLETLLSFFEVIRYTALSEECLRLLLVVFFGSFYERFFEVGLLDIEAGLVGVGFIQAKGDERLDHLLDQTLVDGFAISLELDEPEESAGELLVFALHMQEEVGLPLYKGEL